MLNNFEFAGSMYVFSKITIFSDIVFFFELGNCRNFKPRRGAVNGWIMISFCQEMACLAVYSGF